MPELANSQTGYGVIAALVVFILGSLWLGSMAQRAVESGSFLQGYFLGNRGLGAWALALTATVQSGGTFMGYPAFAYKHGWVVSLWIAGYVVVPLTGFAILAKRFSQLSRRTGAITVPDLFRERYGSPAIGLVASLLIMFFMSFMMVAQFKAGATIMKVAWPNSHVLSLDENLTFQVTSESLAQLEKEHVPPRVLGQLEGLKAQKFELRSDLESELDRRLSPDDAKDFKKRIVDALRPTDWLFYVGLAVFTITVVAYTMMGGFLAAVWTDLFQSVMMFVGVVLLLLLTLQQVGAPDTVTQEVVAAMGSKGPSYVYGPGFGRDFLTPSLAFSTFFVWVFSGVGSPASQVRLMACKDTPTIRRSIVLLGSYNLFIYLPLLVIAVMARKIMPDLDAAGKSDEVIPRMALWTTQGMFGGSFISGLILAAPFGAIMATVSSYLVVIASGLVRDVYQRRIHPQANEATMRRLTQAVIVLVGVGAVAANIYPVDYLQAIVVFCGSGAATSFVVPALMTAFWRRATATGALAAMLGGAATSLVLLSIGLLTSDPGFGTPARFRSYYLLGCEPIVWGLLVSLVAGVAGSLLSTPPPPKLVAQLFDAPPAKGNR